MWLYSSIRYPSPDYDVQYPAAVFEEYRLHLSYTDADGYRHGYVSTGTYVPTEIDFLLASDFEVISSEVNDFEIEFREDKPGSYYMLWEPKDANFDAQWYIYLSPEESALKPQDFLENLNAASLQGKDLSAFAPSYLYSVKHRDNPNQSVNDYFHYSKPEKKTDLRQSRTITKTY